MNPDTPDLLTLQNTLRELQLELASSLAEKNHLANDLEMLRLSQQDSQRESLQAQLEQFFRAAAGPAAQLQVQAHLIEQAGKSVQPRDILLVAKQLVRVLEQNGLHFEGQPGETAAYDPDRHILLTAGSQAQPGQPVVVRIPGAWYQGSLLARAGVEPMRESEDR